MIRALFEPGFSQELAGAFVGPRRFQACDEQGERYVFERGKIGKEVVKLKDESDFLPLTVSAGKGDCAVVGCFQSAQQVQQRAYTMMDEQPLIVGALAVAAGALIGAALPTTQYENRTLGPVRDRTLEKAMVAGEREYQNLRSKLEPRQDTQVSGRAN